MLPVMYSHLSNNPGGWNKRGGWKIFMKSINVELGFYFVEGELFQVIKGQLISKILPSTNKIPPQRLLIS